MRRVLLLAVLALALAAPAAAQKPGDGRLRIEVVQAGLFRVTNIEQRGHRNGIAQFTVKEELERATTVIPGRIGANFGVRFRVAGRHAGATVPVTVTLIFPEPGLRAPGAAEPVRRSEVELTVRVGDRNLSYRGFGFDEPWEIVPGRWRFEFRIGDELLAVQDFTVQAEAR